MQLGKYLDNEGYSCRYYNDVQLCSNCEAEIEVIPNER